MSNKKEHPNVLMIVVDQMRRDALGVNRSGFAYTPHLDQLAREGINFTRAYSCCPSCIAARASLLTGLKPANHGFVGYDSDANWNYSVTLPAVLAQAGYQTQCVGKMHVEPARSLMGFHHVLLHDGFLHDKRRKYRDPIEYDDYLPDIRNSLGASVDICDSGLGCNGYATRCWTGDERFHPTTWVTTKSIEFLKRRDQTKPFFLKVSYHRPHSPLDPPTSFWEIYGNKAMPEPQNGDWTAFISNSSNVENPIPTEKYFQDQARRAYCALVTQIDYELNRIFIALGDMGIWDDTLIIFVSDHGDMLYDHQLVRKAMPFEASAGIPLIFRLPHSMQSGRLGIMDERLTELRDIFPTICNICDVAVPAGLDGQNLLSETSKYEYIHGEHAYGELSNQWLTDGIEKYCWFPLHDRELLFNLGKDPQELHDLSCECPERIKLWQKRLIHELAGRPEGFVKNDKLQTDMKISPSLPWCGKSKTSPS